MAQSKTISVLILLSLAASSLAEEWRWTGKVAVVTGASAGIGAEVAVQLANKGVIVVGLARREKKIEELASKTNGTIHARECDMLNEEKVIETFKWIEDTLGGVDILINNAGTMIPTSLTNGSTAAWKTVMDLNVLSVAISTREALKTMRTRGDSGHIININSIVGHKVIEIKMPSGLYAASKFAITAMTESLTIELGYQNSNIKVSSVSPGLVATELVMKAAEALKDPNQENKLDFSKFSMLQSEDIADAVVYILGTKPHVQISELIIKPRWKSLC